MKVTIISKGDTRADLAAKEIEAKLDSSDIFNNLQFKPFVIMMAKELEDVLVIKVKLWGQSIDKVKLVQNLVKFKAFVASIEELNKYTPLTIVLITTRGNDDSENQYDALILENKVELNFIQPQVKTLMDEPPSMTYEQVLEKWMEAGFHSGLNLRWAMFILNHKGLHDLKKTIFEEIKENFNLAEKVILEGKEPRETWEEIVNYTRGRLEPFIEEHLPTLTEPQIKQVVNAIIWEMVAITP